MATTRSGTKPKSARTKTELEGAGLASLNAAFAFEFKFKLAASVVADVDIVAGFSTACFSAVADGLYPVVASRGDGREENRQW